MFQWDSPLMTFLRTLCNYIFVTILMAICSIPLVTCGAALCAGYDTVRRYLVREEGSHAAGVFFKSFARNFKQSAVIWLILAAICIVFWQGTRVMDALALEGVAPRVLEAMLIIGMFLCFAVLLVALASVARFNNSVGMLLKNSLLLCIMNFWRLVVLLVVIAVAVLLVRLIPPVIFIAPSLVVFYWYRCMEKIFAPHLPEDARDHVEQSNSDE